MTLAYEFDLDPASWYDPPREELSVNIMHAVGGTNVSYCFECGWRGVPNYEDGKPLPECPACTHTDTLPTDDKERFVTFSWDVPLGRFYRGRDRFKTRVVKIQDGKYTSHSKAVNEYKDVGRNDPCPCGSGKKYKKCHG